MGVSSPQNLLALDLAFLLRIILYLTRIFMLVQFPESPLFLNLITPLVLRKGIYGRIDNIEAITQVCKSWQEWIYSDEGPFATIDPKIRPEIRAKPPKCGNINGLNNCLYKAGKVVFKIIKEYAAGKPLLPLSSKDPFNYVNGDLATPLQKALDIALSDISKLELVEYLIKNGADLHHSVHGHRRNYFVYIFTINEKKYSLDNCIQAANLLLQHGLSIHHLGEDGNSLLHHYNCYIDKNGTLLRWYLDNGGDINILNDKGLTPIQHMLSCSRWHDIESLIKAGATCDSPNDTGDYWLHQIIRNKYYYTWNDAFLTRNANVILDIYPAQFFTKDAQGKTPLELAIKLERKAIQNVLFSYADIYLLKKDAPFQISLLKAAVDFVQAKYIGRWAVYDANYYQYTDDSDNDYIKDPYEATLKGRYEENDVKKEILLPLIDLLKKIAFVPQEYTSLFKIADEWGNTFFHHLACICPKLIALYETEHPELSSLFHTTNHKGEDVYELQTKGSNTLNLIVALATKDEFPKYGLDYDLVMLLLNKPICMDMTDIEGNSLLHLARFAVDRKNIKGIYKIMKKLLALGVNPNGINVKGKTPLDYCKKPWQQRIHSLLRSYGGKFSTELANS